MPSRFKQHAVGLLALLAFTGCSQSGKTPPAAAPSAPAKTLETTEAPEKKSTVLAVDPKLLLELLPENMPDLPRKTSKEEYVMAAGVKTSKAQARYGKDKKSVELAILDFAEAQEKIELGYLWTTQDSDRKLENGYEKTGYCQKWFKAFERYDEKQALGEYMVYAGSRFIVSATSQNVEMDALKALFEKIDLKKLAKLR